MLKHHTNLIVKLLLIVSLIILVVFICISAKTGTVESSINTKVVEQKVTRSLIDTPLLYSDVVYVVYYEPDPTKELLLEIQAAIKQLELIDMTEYSCTARVKMYKELKRLKNLEAKVQSDLTHYLTWEEEYYYAAKVWEYFRSRGFNNEITCAIIGNMMIETSGGTLDLNPTIYSPSGNYYGLCQWSQKYCPGTKDLPFEHQLDYLLGSMPWELNTFGKNYKSGFKYEDFIAMTNVSEAALAFAKAYERCGSISYKMRQEAAVIAYEYFDLNS